MIELIVGVNGTEESDRALDWALLEAERTGLPLRAVHAWTTPVWLGGVPGFGFNVLASAEDSRRFAQELVDESVDKALARRASDAPPLVVTAKTLEGEAGRVLSALSTRAAGVVVGGSGRGPLAGALLGSVAQQVLHHGTSPVTVVPPTTPPTAYTRVVVGVDGSDSSHVALRWAAAAARDRSCPLVVVHAWMINTPPVPLAYESLPEGTTFEQDLRTWLQTELAAQLPQEQLETVVPKVVYGSASAVLLEEAGPQDLLVLGSRGHGGFATLLLGSVAQQCAAHSRGAVTILKAQAAG